MICQSTIRRFDGDSSTTLHTAILARASTGLRFVAWVTLDKGLGRYAASSRAPAITLAWVPAERISDESSSPAQIDAALGDPDQVPLLVLERKTQAVGYLSDAGAAFPVVGIKGSPMALAVRLEAIDAGTHGTLTFGWTTRRSR